MLMLSAAVLGSFMLNATKVLGEAKDLTTGESSCFTQSSLGLHGAFSYALFTLIFLVV